MSRQVEMAEPGTRSQAHPALQLACSPRGTCLPGHPAALRECPEGTRLAGLDGHCPYPPPGAHTGPAALASTLSESRLGKGLQAHPHWQAQHLHPRRPRPGCTPGPHTPGPPMLGLVLSALPRGAWGPAAPAPTNQHRAPEPIVQKSPMCASSVAHDPHRHPRPFPPHCPAW